MAGLLPLSLVNSILLTFPFLYHTRVVNYESMITDDGIQDVIDKLSMVLNIEGDIVECGTARCGTAVIIANYLRSKGIEKKVYALDSFGGFDANELDEERRRGLTNVKSNAFGYKDYEYVKNKVEKLNLSDTLIPVNGFFQDTLPNIDSRLCLSFIDCDLEKSIRYCAETVWPKLSTNGIMLFDDYLSDQYKGAKFAIDGFVNKHIDKISEHGLLRRLYYVIKH